MNYIFTEKPENIISDNCYHLIYTNTDYFKLDERAKSFYITPITEKFYMGKAFIAIFKNISNNDMKVFLDYDNKELKKTLSGDMNLFKCFLIDEFDLDKEDEMVFEIITLKQQWEDFRKLFYLESELSAFLKEEEIESFKKQKKSKECFNPNSKQITTGYLRSDVSSWNTIHAS